MEKLRLEFRKSRPRQSNDNALPETKNGAVIRKDWAMPTSRNASPPASTPSAKTFSTSTSTSNRLCFFPETLTDAKGKTRERYRFEQHDDTRRVLDSHEESAKSVDLLRHADREC